MTIMDAISSSNPSQIRRTDNRLPRGIDKEMIKIEHAKLWFLGGREDNRLVGVVGEGEFSIRAVVQSFSPALFTKCIVGDVEWPLTRDSPVLRVGRRCFAFSMPGLIYGLQLLPKYEDILETLEWIFMRFGCYQDHSILKTERWSFRPEEDPYFWPLSQCAIEVITEPLLKQLGTYWIRDETRIYNTKDGVLRVQHMSFIVKLITKGLLIGKIDPAHHLVVVRRTQPPDYNAEADDEIAFPTIFLFSDLVEALEESKVMMSSQYDLIAPYDPRWTPIPTVTFWNINKRGLLLILSAIKGAANINFEVTVKAILGQAYHNFFVPMRIESNEDKEEGRGIGRQEIRFPILDVAGSSVRL